MSCVLLNRDIIKIIKTWRGITGTLNNDVKKELVNALDDKNESVFMVEGKLISVEIHDTDSYDEESGDLVQEIEAYPELKESLQRYLNNPDMKRFTAKDLKEPRHDQRK